MLETFLEKAILILSEYIQSSVRACFCKYKKNQRVELIHNNNVAYLKSGSVSVCRKDDDLMVTTVNAPFILGLTQMRSENKSHYFRCNNMCEMWVISTEDAEKIFTRNNLWKHVFDILSWNISVYFQREKMITKPNNREIIREQIKYIWSMSPDMRNRTSVYLFIMARNHISRSMIHKIILEMSNTHNVIIEKGKLISYEDKI